MKRSELVKRITEDPELQDALDEIVYETFMSRAITVNNKGPEKQIEYLIASGHDLDLIIQIFGESQEAKKEES